MRIEHKEFRVKADQQERNAEMFAKRAERFYEDGDFANSTKAIKSSDAAWVDYHYYTALADACLSVSLKESFDAIDKKEIELEKTITIEDAKAWQATDEKFTFCVDFLDISANHRKANALVEELETKFESILAS